MKKQFLIIAALFYGNVYGQDILIYRSGPPAAVTILNETPSQVFVQKFNDTTAATRYNVDKSNLKGIRHQNDSITFAAMSSEDFYSLGKKHAKEFEYPSDLLLNNADYMKGYEQKSKSLKKGRTLLIVGV